MNRNLKTLGLALIAVLAMSALVASAAQGITTTKTEFTPLNNAATVLHGEQISLHDFTIDKRAIACEVVTFTGEIPGNTTHAKIIPTYEKCNTTPVFFIIFPVTVTMNGCWYTLTGENTVAAGKYGVQLHLECPAGQKVEMHVYNNAAHTELLCTITIEPQTPHGLLVATNAGTGPKEDIMFDANTTNITTTIHGSFCGGTENTNKEFSSEYHGPMTYNGFQGGNQVNVTVSDTTVNHP